MEKVNKVSESVSTKDVPHSSLTLPDELVLMLLDEESGFFHQIPGWNLNCALAGAVLAELSLKLRIDTDVDSLVLLDSTPTGDPVLDPFLEEIVAETTTQNSSYWIERFAHRGESICDDTLGRLVDKKLLEHHDGDFWTFTRAGTWLGFDSDEEPISHHEFVKSRIERAIFTNEIPDPRDILVICLVNTCDVFRFIYQLDEEAEERINHICQMDLIGRCISEAVSHNLAGPLLQYSGLTRRIPTIPLHKLLFNPHLRTGNLSAVFGSLAKEFGPVFRLPMSPMVFLAGPDTNHWVHRHGRTYLRTRDYFLEFESIYGSAGVLPSLDGADHFRVRKAMSPGYSRTRLEGQLNGVYEEARKFMADWKIGDTLRATPVCRRMVNAQVSRLFLAVDSQDIFEDLALFKERALCTHVVKCLPKFMLKTPKMKRRGRSMDVLLERIQKVHTPAQRAGCPRNLADDWLSLHASDPQLVSAMDLRFYLTAALVASVYLGDSFSFMLYAMVTQPELYRQIQDEADALFGNGDPRGSDIRGNAIDVTHRFVLECHRMYPVVVASFRDLMNPCTVEGFQLPPTSRVVICQTASHYMDNEFPDPHTFDIDRYKSPRNEHRSRSYAPYGLGTHFCLGNRWMELQAIVNLLMVAHYFTLEVYPKNFKFKINPFPSLSPSKKLHFLVAEQRRELETSPSST